MTHEELIRIAKAAGMAQLPNATFPSATSPVVLVRFARIVQDAERVRCAAIARQMNAPAVAGAIEGEGK